MLFEELVRYYTAAYTQEQLAQMVALSTEGVAPPAPPEDYEAAAVPVNRSGRPTVAIQVEKHGLLRIEIEKAYPHLVPAAHYAHLTGMSQSTIHRLKNDERFLLSLPLHLRSFFHQTPYQPTERLPALWRGILTLHYYALGLMGKEHLKNLYTNHAAMWGANQATLLDRSRRNSRNNVERGYLEQPNFHKWLTTFDYPTEVVTEDHPFTAPICVEGCPIVTAYLGGSGRYAYLEQARDLIDRGGGVAIPWRKSQVEGVVVDAPRSEDVIAKILGGWF